MVFRLDLKIFIFLIIFYFTKQIKLYSIIMFFAIIHECSHLLAGIIFKMKIKKISLMPLGLSIEFKIAPEEYNKKILNSNMLQVKKIIIAIIGAITNFIIALVVNYLNIDVNLKQNIIYSNILIGVFNLLPIYPLDGGRVISSILNIFTNKKLSMIYVNYISNVTIFLLSFLSSILIYYSKNIAILFIMVYLWYIIIKENKFYRMKRNLYNLFENKNNLL